MTQCKTLHGDEPTKPPTDLNSQPSAAHFKPRAYPTKTSPVVSAIMGRLNHHAVDNGDVEVHPSEFPDEYNSEYVPDPETTPIKSIDDDEMDHLMELSHSEDDDDLLDVDLQMIQD